MKAKHYTQVKPGEEMTFQQFQDAVAQHFISQVILEGDNSIVFRTGGSAGPTYRIETESGVVPGLHVLAYYRVS